MKQIARKFRWPLKGIVLAAIAALALLPILKAATTAPSTKPAGPPKTTRDLLAHSDEEHFWIAQIQPPTDSQPYEQTSLMVRGSFGEPWAQMPSVPERIVNLASSSGELVLVLDDGQWWIGDKDGYRPGSSPVAATEVLAMANDQSELWCIALGTLTPQKSTTSTAPATSSAPATQPSTAPSAAPPLHLIAYRMDAGNWVGGTLLPPEVPESSRKISMTIVDRTPVIAWQQGDHNICISRLKGAWLYPQTVTIAPDSNFKLFTIADNAALWVSAPPTAGQPPSAGTLYTGYDFAKATVLPLSSAQGPPAGQTLTPAFGNLHWLAASGSVANPPIDQEFGLDGRLIGTAKTVAGPPPQTIPLGPCILTAGAMVLFAAVAAMRQRGGAARASEPVDVSQRLAPLGMRFAAGLVDLLPCLAALAVVHPVLPNGLPAKIDPASTGKTLMWLALLTYVLHTMVAELICRQSLGKILFDLRVVDNAGKPASVTSIILRNVFRGIDVTLVAVPLLYIFIAPLRQRIGDLVAGTVVIGEEADVEEENDPQER